MQALVQASASTLETCSPISSATCVVCVAVIK